MESVGATDDGLGLPLFCLMVSQEDSLNAEGGLDRVTLYTLYFLSWLLIYCNLLSMIC